MIYTHFVNENEIYILVSEYMFSANIELYVLMVSCESVPQSKGPTIRPLEPHSYTRCDTPRTRAVSCLLVAIIVNLGKRASGVQTYGTPSSTAARCSV